MLKKIDSNYFYFIDLLRILAILGSFLHHSEVIYFLYGHSFFFFLSGFLLTHRFSQEIQKYHQFDFWAFTIRRLLKIIPLYYLIVLFTYFVLPYFTSIDFKTIPIYKYLFFISNYSTDTSHIFILMILWSVSVQEQFYFFISFVFKFFNTYITAIAIGMILFSLAFKIYYFKLDKNVYAYTLNHFSTYGFGMLYACYFEKINEFITAKMSLILFLASIFSLYFFSFTMKENVIWILFDNIFVSIFFIFIFNFLLKSKSILIHNKIVHFFGNLYYGMYCYQGIVITFTNFVILKYFNLNLISIVFINLLLLLIISTLSFYLFEKPISLLREKLKIQKT